METWRLEKVVAWMREVARNDSTVGQTRKVTVKIHEFKLLGRQIQQDVVT